MADGAAYYMERDDWIRLRTEQGYRIVSGGQVGPHEESGALWRVHDLDGNLLAEGRGLESFNEAYESNNWWDEGRFEGDLKGPETFSAAHPELPASLVNTLWEWVENREQEALELLQLLEVKSE